MSFLDWIIAVGLNAAIIIYGFYLSRGVRSSADWFLAGRKLPWWLVGLSMYATAIDSSDLVADSGGTYLLGMSYFSMNWVGSVVGWSLAAFFIFLPIFISNSKIYLNEFERFLLNLKRKIRPLTVINHPQMENSKPHLNLVEKLNALIKANKQVFSEDSKQSETLIFGASSLVIEALERDYKFIHICAEPILESYSKIIWPSINVTKINDYVFKYSLKNFGSCVNLGIENNMFQKYCIN